MASLGVISIGCDSCNSRYHSTHFCLGLSDSIVNITEEYGGRVLISFVLVGWRGEVVVMGHTLAMLLMVVEV